MWLDTFKHTDDKNPDLKDQYEEMEQNVTSVLAVYQVGKEVLARNKSLDGDLLVHKNCRDQQLK